MTIPLLTDTYTFEVLNIKDLYNKSWPNIFPNALRYACTKHGFTMIPYPPKVCIEINSDLNTVVRKAKKLNHEFGLRLLETSNKIPAALFTQQIDTEVIQELNNEYGTPSL